MDSDGLYSIGQVSHIMGVSVQALRHYCNMGLITPEYIDPATGYRYFSRKQLHYIDRSRYLIKCDFSLKEIREVFRSNDIDLLVEMLDKKKEKKRREIEEAQAALKTIEWYRDYFTYSNTTAEDNGPGTYYYVRPLEKRYLLATEVTGPDFSSFYPLYKKLISEPPYNKLTLQRQFYSLRNYYAMMNRRVKAQYTGMLITGEPDFQSPHIFELPAGDYYCFKAPILSSDWNPHVLQMFLDDGLVPRLVVTAEYENDLTEFSHCPHEVQILFG